MFNNATLKELSSFKFKKKRHAYIANNIKDLNALASYIKSFTDKNSMFNREVTRFRQNQREFEAIPSVNLKPNKFLNRYRILCNPSIQHKPSNLEVGNWIGVEIECIIPKNQFEVSEECDGAYCDNHEDNCHNCGCEHECDDNGSYIEALKEFITDCKIKYIQVKTDGSISAPEGFFGAELTILTKHHDRENLKKLCKILNNLGVKVNKSCGLHVHFDQRTRTSEQIKKTAAKLGACLPFLIQLVPKSRLQNTYCQLGVSKFNGSRYWAINLTSVKKYGTIEVRLHSSTTDFEKINNWIDILLIIQQSPSITTCNSLDDFIFNFDVPEYLIEYMTERIAKFNNLIKINQYAARPVEEYDIVNPLSRSA